VIRDRHNGNFSVSGLHFAGFVVLTVFFGILAMFLLPLFFSSNLGARGDFFGFFGAALIFGSFLWGPIALLMGFPGFQLYRLVVSLSVRRGISVRLAVALGTTSVTIVGSLGILLLGAAGGFRDFFAVYFAITIVGFLATPVAGQVVLVPGLRERAR
jgi:hypothetical protein